MAAGWDAEMIYNTIAKQADAAWKCSWDKFFCEKTSLFYDYLTSADLLERHVHLPKPEEIAADRPNRTSWNSGMEDSSINAGIMMEGVVNRFAVTGEEAMRDCAARIFKGMVNCATVHGVHGFIARSISPFDCRSVYRESSRDQYTHYVQGLFKFYNSPLSGEKERKTIRGILSWICDFMTAHVKEESDWSFPALDMQKPCSVCKVWKRNSWADARLPMFYAAAWSVTGRKEYYEKFREYAHEAADITLRMPPVTIEGFLQYQIQCSLELIRDVAVGDDVLREKCARSMRMIAELGVFYAWETRHHEKKTDFSILFSDWRKAESFYGKEPYRIPLFRPEMKDAFEKLRNSFQTAIVQFMAPGWRFSEFQKILLFSRMREIDFENCNNSGVLYPACAFWKGRACGMIAQKEADEPFPTE